MFSFLFAHLYQECIENVVFDTDEKETFWFFFFSCGTVPVVMVWTVKVAALTVSSTVLFWIFQPVALTETRHTGAPAAADWGVWALAAQIFILWWDGVTIHLASFPKIRHIALTLATDQSPMAAAVRAVFLMASSAVTLTCGKQY